jgi:hypothetical protein
MYVSISHSQGRHSALPPLHLTPAPHHPCPHHPHSPSFIFIIYLLLSLLQTRSLSELDYACGAVVVVDAFVHARVTGRGTGVPVWACLRTGVADRGFLVTRSRSRAAPPPPTLHAPTPHAHRFHYYSLLAYSDELVPRLRCINKSIHPPLGPRQYIWVELLASSREASRRS